MWRFLIRDSLMKLSVAPESMSVWALVDIEGMKTDNLIRFDVVVDVSAACLNTPMSAGYETTSFPTEWQNVMKQANT